MCLHDTGNNSSTTFKPKAPNTCSNYHNISAPIATMSSHQDVSVPERKTLMSKIRFLAITGVGQFADEYCECPYIYCLFV